MCLELWASNRQRISTRNRGLKSLVKKNNLLTLDSETLRFSFCKHQKLSSQNRFYAAGPMCKNTPFEPRVAIRLVLGAPDSCRDCLLLRHPVGIRQSCWKHFRDYSRGGLNGNLDQWGGFVCDFTTKDDPMTSIFEGQPSKKQGRNSNQNSGVIWVQDGTRMYWRSFTWLC